MGTWSNSEDVLSFTFTEAGVIDINSVSFQIENYEANKNTEVNEFTCSGNVSFAGQTVNMNFRFTSANNCQATVNGEIITFTK